MAQSADGCLIPESIHSQAALSSQQPRLVEDGIGLDGLSRSAPTQTNP